MAMEMTRFEREDGTPVNVDDGQKRPVLGTRIESWEEYSPAAGGMEMFRHTIHTVGDPTGPGSPPPQPEAEPVEGDA